MDHTYFGIFFQVVGNDIKAVFCVNLRCTFKFFDYARDCIMM